MTADHKPDPARLGPLKPQVEPGRVIIENPPAAPMHMTAEEADISAIRLLDAAAAARKARDFPGDK